MKNTSSCVHAKRIRVCWQQVHMYETRARGAGTHGARVEWTHWDVLSGHKPHTTHTTTHHMETDRARKKTEERRFIFSVVVRPFFVGVEYLILTRLPLLVLIILILILTRPLLLVIIILILILLLLLLVLTLPTLFVLIQK